ncbi:hypothetical protein [Salaquimonas pukyongi]|uniref:hypothetical protein n=1 Tax=Salaquimonas pukyongi TaxID=2712698 RepID=UPI001FCDDC87|nr:hypothetical protein [Salaquimonas pukyongi]
MNKIRIREALTAVLVASALAFILPVAAQAADSAYTKLDFDKGCAWKKAESEEEAQMGGEAVCKGLAGYPVHFAESDLRQFLAYGPVTDPFAFPSGFAQWNSVHDTLEWRLEDGKPFATIHRWFIDNINPDTGSAEEARRGQVLVVSTVADPDLPEAERVSCVAGYVDALANRDANVLARIAADDYAAGFRCGIDRPVFHGERGERSGTPNGLQD